MLFSRTQNDTPRTFPCETEKEVAEGSMFVAKRPGCGAAGILSRASPVLSGCVKAGTHHQAELLGFRAAARFRRMCWRVGAEQCLAGKFLRWEMPVPALAVNANLQASWAMPVGFAGLACLLAIE